MKLGRRSQSMPWISCPGIISTERRRGEKETDTNQSLWRHLDYTSPPTPSIHPLSPACHHQALPLSTLLLFICFSVFSVVCLPLGWKLCVYMCSIMYVCVCVCVKALWNDALIHSVLYFLIWLTITVRVNRRRISLSLSLAPSSFYFLPISLPRSLFLWVSEYHVVEWKCLRGVLYCRYKRRVWSVSACIVHERYVLYLCMLVCISMCYFLTWNTVLSIQECMLF